MKYFFCLALLLLCASACKSTPVQRGTLGGEICGTSSCPVSKALGNTSASLTGPIVNCSVSDIQTTTEEFQFFDLLNAYRAQIGVDEFGRPISQLIMSVNLNLAASWTVNDLATRADHVFEHIDSLGRSPAQRRTDCGNPTPGYGENIAGGYSSPQSALNAFKASPGHNANMLIWDAVQVGIAKITNSNSPWNYYWAMESSWADDGTRVERGGESTPLPIPTTLVPPSVTPTSTATVKPTSTVKPTATPKPSATPKPTATPFPYRCQRQTGGGWITIWTRKDGGQCP